MLNPFQPLPNRYVLIDCENGDNANTDKIAKFLTEKKYINNETFVFCFFGKNKISSSWKNGISKNITDLSNFSFIDTNENADPIINACVGALRKDNPQAEFVIISHDKGFAPLVNFFKAQKTNIRQEEIIDKKGKVFGIKEAKQKLLKLTMNQKPKKLESLKNYINFNFSSSTLDQEKLIEQLKTEGIIKVKSKRIIWNQSTKENHAV